jgi:NADH-quinone oxidoreductase subunit C
MQDGLMGVEWVRENHADAIVSDGEYGGQHWVQLAPGTLVDVCRELRENPATTYDLLVDVTAVHWPGQAEPMELVYHLYSLDKNDRLRIKVRCSDQGPTPSLAGIWRSADWNERETYDMFGIQFEGHPDMRRILMPDDYSDFPLRKEFPLYRG